MRKIAILLLLLAGFVPQAQENLPYQLPPASIMELADYERAPSVQMNSKKTYMLLSYRPTYKSLDDLNQEEMRLGGLRVNPKTHISSTVTYINNLKVRKLSQTNEVQVSGLPNHPKLANISFSPDEAFVAFTHTEPDGLSLYILELATAKARKISDGPLNATLGNPVTWYADSKALLVKMLPKDRKSLIDHGQAIPTGPTISTADGTVSQNRTYQDLLKNKIDEENFETLIAAELHRIDLNGAASLFKKADMYASETFSPDGHYLMVTTIQKPFSYIVPLSRFPMLTQVFDTSGTLVKTVNDIPLAEVMPKGFMAVRKGWRNMNWRSDQPATLVFVEALDEGDPAIEVPFRDEVFTWKAPFEAAPESLVKTQQRYGGIIWGNATTAVLSDQWYDTRSTRSFLFDPSQSGKDMRKIFDRNSQDIYSNPGRFETVKNEYGRYVLAMNNHTAYLIGDGYSEKGQFPFIDAFDLKTLQTKRLYQSSYTNKKEDIFSLEDVKKGLALVRIQSKNEYPNYYWRNINRKNSITPLTSFKNPFESIADVHKEVIKYKRKDGVDLSGTLYLPKGYDKKKKEKLPLLIWAYPAEYKDKNTAGQSSQNPNEFTFPYYGSFVYWVTRGYAVLDDAAFPIVGEGETEPNDTFVQQLVDNAEAAIQAVDRLGYIDPARVAVGGHSYGAFMTANLLTHSNLFVCGIARSGAYNRTLTPFGFQREQRNYWEVPEVYNGMSPFMTAHKMKTPMLLVHGEADNNPGTFTLQTERYFQALKGLGAPVRMVILPKESHGYVARENILHLLWEQDQFLEKYLKK